VGGFGAQRNKAALLASRDWVLFLDADERASPGLIDEIQQVLSEGAKFPAYSCPRRNTLLGHRMTAGGWWPDRQVRLINRLEASYAGVVHEIVDVPPAAVGRLQNELLHQSHSNLSELLARVDSYSRLEAEDAQATAKPRPLRLEVYIRPWLHFLHRFVGQRGFCDGSTGLAEARVQAYYLHLRHLRRRYGPESEASALFRRLIPKNDPQVDADRQAGVPLSPLSVRDPLAIGLAVLLLLLPFHLLIKSVLPGSLGLGWKEAVIAGLTCAALWRMRGRLVAYARHSWLIRLIIGYLTLVIAASIASPYLGSAFDGLRVDATYAPLAIVALAIGHVERRAVIVLTTILVAVISSGGAFAEAVLRRALLPSQLLTDQYGRPEVYVAATHILRPYFEFDFPTGLGAYLAVGCVFAVSLYVVNREWWMLAAAGVCAAALTLTFSRGPWLGAVAGLVAIAAAAGGISRWIRFALIAGLVALLVCGATVTSIKGGAFSKPVVLQESPQLRAVAGTRPIGHMVTSFLRSGDQVERSGMPPTAGGQADTFWTIDHVKAWVLAEPAPAHGKAILGYRLYVPDSSVLTWGIALDPKVWSPDKGDGVIFGISIKDAFQSVAMYAIYLDPKNVPADRHIIRYALPLFGYAGETVVVELTSQAGPRGDANFDAAGWLNPRLTRVPINTNFETYPYRPLPFTMLAKPLVNSQNYVGSIVNWQTDRSNTDRISSWQRSIQAWSTSPISGLGPGSVDEAAVRAGGPQPLITESQIVKVLVETGLAGLALWIALCTRGLLVAWAACRRQPELLWILAGLVCICVSSLAFQVLEVKQIAALFWVLIGCAISLELGKETGPAPASVVPAHSVAALPQNWWGVLPRKVREKASGAHKSPTASCTS
jgi:hypothetical protein